MRSSYAVGLYQSGEGTTILRPSAPHDELRGVVFCHGAGGLSGNAVHLTGVPSQSRLLRRIAAAGHVILSADLGGMFTWGNDTSITRLGQAITYLRSLDGVADIPPVVLGVSMGGLIALNHAKANPSAVAGVIGLIPVIDPEYVRANDVVGSASIIDSAYGGSYDDSTQRADHNPSYWGPLLSDFVPTRLWHASDDIYCPLATYEAFDVTPDTTLFNVGALGHDEDAVAAADEDAELILNFIGSPT